MSNPKVFIILLNWNNWDETKECLESLKKVDYPNFEILLVDNGSLTPPIIPPPYNKGGIGGVIPIFNEENLGFAGGNNVGIQYALKHNADYVLLLNNDTVVAPDFLTKLVEMGDSSEKFGILGSRIYQYGSDEVVFDGGKVNGWLTKGEHIKIAEVGPRQVDYITGAAMLVKREVIEKISLMREEYFLYYEDVDWCLRSQRAGYKCVLVPESHVWHKVSATNKEGSASYIYYHTRNSLMLAKFNGNAFQKIISYFIGFWTLSKQAVKFVLFPSKRLWARAMAKGAIDFYLGKYGIYENRN